MGLVAAIPTTCIRGCNLQTGLKAAVNHIAFLFSHKAIGIGLPGKQQRLAIDGQLLAITGIRRYGQSNRIAQTIALLVCCHRTVIQSRNGNRYRHFAGIVGQSKGNVDHLSLIAVVVNTKGSNLVGRCDTIHRIGIQSHAVQSDLKLVCAGANQLELCAVALKLFCDAGNLRFQSTPAAPTGHTAACAKPGVDVARSAVAVFLLIEDTETISLTVIHGNRQHHREAGCSAAFCAISLRQIVLGIHCKELILAIDLIPPGVVIAGIIGRKNAVSLVAAIPTTCIGGSYLQAGFKAAANHIAVFFRHKAVSIGLPIQKQRLTVNGHLLAVAGSRCYCQCYCVANLINRLIGSHITIFKSIDDQFYKNRSIDCLERNHQILIQITVHPDGHSGLFACDSTVHTGCNHFRKIISADFGAVQNNMCSGAANCNPELNTIPLHLVGFRIAQGICILPRFNQRAAAHRLNSVFAIVIGMIQAKDKLFTIGEDKTVDHGEVSGIRCQILHNCINIVHHICRSNISGMTGRMTLQLQLTLVLIDQLPRGIAILCKDTGGKACRDIVSVLGSLKAVSSIPIQLHRSAIHRQHIIVVPFNAGNIQRNGIAQLVAGFFRCDCTVFCLGNVQGHILGIVFQAERDHSIAVQVAVQTERYRRCGIFNTAGLTGLDIGGKVVGTDLLAIDKHIGCCSQNLHAVGNAIGHRLLCFFLCQRIVVFPRLKQCAVCKGLNSVLAVVISVIESHPEVLTIGELENIDHRIVISLRGQILGNGGHIIGYDFGIQPGILAGSREFGKCSVVLIGNIPNLSRPVERRACHIYRKISRNLERNFHHRPVVYPELHTKLCRTSFIGIAKLFNNQQRIPQPNSRQLSLTHNPQAQTVLAEILGTFCIIQYPNGFPVRHGIVTGEFCILQDKSVIFLHQVNMPGLSIAESNPHAAALLQEIIRAALLSQFCIVFQVDGVIEIMIRIVAHQNTGAAHFIDDAVILFIQNPA